MNLLREMSLIAIALAMAGCASPQKYATQSNDAERHACAAVGIAPGGGRFSQCVADLDSNVSQSQVEHQR